MANPLIALLIGEAAKTITEQLPGRRTSDSVAPATKGLLTSKTTQGAQVTIVAAVYALYQMGWPPPTPSAENFDLWLAMVGVVAGGLWAIYGRFKAKQGIG